MAIRPGGEVLRRIRTLFDVGTVNGLTDGELLEWFTTRERGAAELAFAALVERHGPMVLRVCRRTLTDPHEAQDAFQATFLVLVRRAAAVRRRDSLSSWLHGVALRVAGCARKAGARRRRLELRAAKRAAGADQSPSEEGDVDLGSVLHEELAGLPARFREPLVMCYLQGRSCDEAARRLGWPVGTVKSRLARGRERLRGRLTRRGLSPSVGALGTALAAEQARASVPAALAGLTTEAAGALAAGQAGSGGAVPSAVAGLMKGVLVSMFINQLARSAAALLALGVVAAGAGALARQPAGDARAAVPHELSKVSTPPYVVEPPDMISVEVLEALPGRPLSGERLVRPDGKVSLGYYGEVYVAGLTPDEIKEKVVQHLREHLTERQLGLVAPDLERPGRTRAVSPRNSATVKVDVTAYNSKVYYVQGEVAAPGRLPITGNETVLDAINYAGGLLPTGAASGVTLVRLPVPGTEPAQVLKPDLVAIVNRGDPSTNYQLRNGDRLIVARDPKAEAGQPALAPRPAADDFRALERRLGELERKMDRMIEMLGGAQALPETRQDGGAKPTPREVR